MLLADWKFIIISSTIGKKKQKYFIREKISYRWNNWWINLKTFCQKSEVDKNTNTDKHNSYIFGRYISKESY